MEENKPRRSRRSKADIESGIKNAAGNIILKKGFSGMTVLDIIKQAKIEPITFYNRYKNLEEFYDVFVREYDYWFSDMLKMSRDEAYDRDRYIEIFRNLFECLKDDSIMLELLRWEISDSNAVTRRSAMNREVQTLPLTEIYGNKFKGSDIDFVAVSALMIAGIYYLNLHRKCSPFCGIDVATDAGRDRLMKAIEALANLLFRKRESVEDRVKSRAAIISERMRQRGFTQEDIDYCLADTDDHTPAMK